MLLFLKYFKKLKIKRFIRKGKNVIKFNII
jgi:hypothetical protein